MLESTPCSDRSFLPEVSQCLDPCSKCRIQASHFGLRALRLRLDAGMHAGNQELVASIHNTLKWLRSILRPSWRYCIRSLLITSLKPEFFPDSHCSNLQKVTPSTTKYLDCLGYVAATSTWIVLDMKLAGFAALRCWSSFRVPCSAPLSAS